MTNNIIETNIRDGFLFFDKGCVRANAESYSLKTNYKRDLQVSTCGYVRNHLPLSVEHASKRTDCTRVYSVSQKSSRIPCIRFTWAAFLYSAQSILLEYCIPVH